MLMDTPSWLTTSLPPLVAMVLQEPSRVDLLAALSEDEASGSAQWPLAPAGPAQATLDVFRHAAETPSVMGPLASRCPPRSRSSPPSPLRFQTNAAPFLPTRSLPQAWPPSGKAAPRPATSKEGGRRARPDGLSTSIVGGKVDVFWSTPMARRARQPYTSLRRPCGTSSSSSRP